VQSSDCLLDVDGCFADFDEIEIDPEARARRLAKRVLARATRTRSRIHTRRASSEATLGSLLPSRIDVGDSWHVISGGDVDSLSYAAHVLNGEPFQRMVLSTWCMAIDDVATLRAWLDAGKLKRLDCYVGEIFPSQYQEAYAALCAAVRAHQGRVATFRNHSKVMLLGNDSTQRYIVIESSANVNTNPRTEQTSVTADAELFRFYDDFFADIKSYSRNFDDWQRHGTTA
jgi:hypothetical protein